MTIEQIIEFATENNLRYEAYSTMFDRWGDESSESGRTSVGIELTLHVWYWFDGYLRTYIAGQGYKSSSRYGLIFSHRYNQTNGHTIKSSNQGWKAKRIIEGELSLKKAFQ